MASKKKLLQAAAGSAGGAGLDVDEVFSTYCYTGDSSSGNEITGIDTLNEGGLVWLKWRSGTNAFGHALYDTVRGNTKQLRADNASAESTEIRFTGFLANGFSLSGDTELDYNGDKYVAWTFRKAPKFFDVVTYTGDGTHPRTISHNLGSSPGAVIIKKYSGTDNWNFFHRGLSSGVCGTGRLYLNATNSTQNSSLSFFTPSSTSITLGSDTGINDNGFTYVAYLFAHNDSGDGGFGPDGDADIIKCGSYTGTGSAGNSINLGFEPQWLMVKNASTANQNWEIFDNMRGVATGGIASELFPNASSAERSSFNIFNFNATGFETESTLDETNASGDTYIYMAIRRGPLAAPDDATKVFQPSIYTGAGGSGQKVSLDITPDMVINMSRSTSGDSPALNDRLRGTGKEMYTSGTGGESSYPSQGMQFDHTNALRTQSYRDTNNATYLNLCWKRAPSYFDVVAYQGTGSNRTVSHNLGVVPEMMWIKRRDSTNNWAVYHKGLDSGNNPETHYLILNTTAAEDDVNEVFNDTAPTSSVFSVGTASLVNNSSGTFIAYLFATVAGLSKVGSFTISGSDITVDCGFSSGARFVLIKRSSGTDDWYVFDTVRGYVSGSGDAALKLNSTAAESSMNMIDPHASGFSLRAAAWYNGDYIFYAIA